MKFSILNFQFSIFLIIFLEILVFFPSISLSAGLVPCGPGTAKEYCELCDFFVLFKNIIEFVLWKIVPPIAILMIAIGGFYLLFSEGKPEAISRGKNIIKTTLIGLVIIFAAWLVVNLFFQIIGVQEWTGLFGPTKKWWQIPCN